MKQIDIDEHVFIAGRTGSGKSYLAERYLSGYENVVMLDTKGETLKRIKERERGEYSPLWAGVPDERVQIAERLDDLEQLGAGHIIYVPRYQELNFDSYNEFYRWAYFRQNTIVWTDEVFSVAPNPHKMPEYLQAILTRGRSRNTAHWGLSQRPSGLPQVVMSEATHFFIFDLNMPQDRDKLADITGATEFYERPERHTFWYYHVAAEHAVKARLVER